MVIFTFGGSMDAVIRSRQNKTVKTVAALANKKQREESRLFRFDGIKLAREALMKGVLPEYLIVSESKSDTAYSLIREYGLPGGTVVTVSDDIFAAISEEKSPEGIITVAKYLDKLRKIVKIGNNGHIEELPEIGERLIILESVRDPGNLGTIVRTAAALGIDRVILSSDCADIYNPRTIRAAMGALFMQRVDIVEARELPRYIGDLRNSGRRVFAAALGDGASKLGSFPSAPGDCVVIGNEGHGLSAGTLGACDGSVIIPMRDGCESLNAATAAAIFMWEFSRGGL